MTPVTPTSTAVALPARDPWALVPSLGNLDAYITAVNRLPMLTAQEEVALAQRLQRDGDVQAAGQLVLSHLRLVVSVARQYLGYGLPHGDLIQEGNVGLMKAVKRFDPDQGVRLVSYALHWIKAEMHDYILKNWRIVKVATTKSQRKLFFNLRSLKAQLQADAADGHQHHASLTAAQVDAVATKLQVKRQDVVEMEVRMGGGDVALEPVSEDSETQRIAPIHSLRDDAQEPTRVLEARARDELATQGVARALATLDARSRRIVESRWLQDADEGGALTLHELAAEYGVSAERIRQIESAAMKKMRLALAAA